MVSGSGCDDSLQLFDLLGSSLRTSLLSELAALTKCSARWKRSVTPAGRSWGVLMTSARRTGASGCSSWPTAHGMDNGGNPRRNGPTGNELGRAVTRDWFTPQGRDWKDSGPTQGNRKSVNLGVQAARDWQTPNAMAGGSVSRGGKRIGEKLLAGQADQESRSTSGKPRDWSTPQAFDANEVPNGNAAERRTKGGCRNLGQEIGGSLNPAWVSQLMGFFDGWTDLPAETLLELWATQSSGKSRTSLGAPSLKSKEA